LFRNAAITHTIHTHNEKRVWMSSRVSCNIINGITGKPTKCTRRNSQSTFYLIYTVDHAGVTVTSKQKCICIKANQRSSLDMLTINTASTKPRKAPMLDTSIDVYCLLISHMISNNTGF